MAPQVILVSGANRGIGFAICQVILQRQSDIALFVGSRTIQNAEEAVRELEQLGLKAEFHPTVLDVTVDQSISSAVADVQAKYGRLDVLINNAGIAGGPSPDNADFRRVWSRILDTNVTSVALTSTLFLPLLQKSTNPRIINVSSARGSLSMVTQGKNPPTDKIPYSVSKAALNLLTVEMSHSHPEIEFQVTNPGWCKTAFNGYRGPKDPLEGAISTAELALAVRGTYKPSFWQFEHGEMKEVPW